MNEQAYRLVSTDTLQTLYKGLKEWLKLHPSDREAVERLQLVAQELKRRGVENVEIG